MSIVWLDLETSGLKARTCRVLEVGVIITDDKLDELARYHAIPNEARQLHWHDVNPFVLDMHAKSALWGQSLASQTPLFQVDADLRALVIEHCYGGRVPDDEKVARTMSPILGGNTVDFDRNFADEWLPGFAQLLHYRSLNVSSLNEFAKRFQPNMYESRPNNPEPVHRVMADIEESIRVCRHYRHRIADGVYAN